MASIIGFSIVNVKRALLQRSCGIYSNQRYRYRTCWVIYLTKGRNLIKGAILSGHQIYLEICGLIATCNLTDKVLIGVYLKFGLKKVQRCVKGAYLLVHINLAGVRIGLAVCLI